MLETQELQNSLICDLHRVIRAGDGLYNNLCFLAPVMGTNSCSYGILWDRECVYRMCGFYDPKISLSVFCTS